MPRPATLIEEQQAAAPVPMDAAIFQKPNIQSARMRVPITQALVVYMGSLDNKSGALPGMLVRNKRGDRIQVSLSEAGIESYDFSKLDSMGDVITQRLVPDTYPPDVRGRPSLRIDHAEHLRRFARMKDDSGSYEFQVRLHPDDLQTFEEYVHRKERSLQANERNVTEIAA